MRLDFFNMDVVEGSGEAARVAGPPAAAGAVDVVEG